jgi:hypothetical protein
MSSPGLNLKFDAVSKSDGVLEALFEFEKAMKRSWGVVSSVAVTTWFAEEALPLRLPTNKGAVMEPLVFRFPVLGLKKKPPLVFRDVAVPPVAVLVNRTF